MAKKMAEERVFPPMHPGRFLELEFLEPLGMTQYALAKAIGVDPPRIYEIVAGERDITADTALRLARYFGTSTQYWLNLQNRYDLEEALMCQVGVIGTNYLRRGITTLFTELPSSPVLAGAYPTL